MTIHSLEPADEAGTLVVTAARDLTGATVLAPDDVTLAEVPSDALPDGAVAAMAEVQGRRTAGPIRAGEIITDVRLVGAALLDGWGDDLAAVPVRIADPATAQLVRPGDVVDIVATDVSGAGVAGILAAAVPVLAVPVDAETSFASDGALLVVAATPEQVRDLAAAAVTSRLSIALTH